MTTDQGTPPKPDLQNLSKRVDLIIKHKDQLIEILQEKVEKLPVIEEESKAMREKIARLETETHIANQQIEKLKSDLVSGNLKELQHLQEDNLQLREHLNSLEQKLSSQLKENEQQKRKFQEEKALESNKLGDENAGLKSKIAVLESAEKLAKDKLEELQGLLKEDKFEKIQFLHLENLKLKHKLEEVSSGKLLLSDKREGQPEVVNQDNLDEIRKLRETNQALNEKIKLHDGEIEKLKHEVKIAHIEAAGLKPEKSALENDLIAREKEVAILKSRLGELLIVQNRADENEVSLRQKIRDLEEEIAAQQKKFNNLLEGIEGANEVTRQKNSEIAHLNGKIDELKHLISLKSGEYDGLLIDLDQEKKLRHSLEKDLENERIAGAQVVLLREELKKSLEKETQLNDIIVSLRKGIASLNEKFSNFLFEQKARKEVSYLTDEPQTPEIIEETPPKNFRHTLPLCFPERPPRILRARKKTLSMKEPSLAEYKKPFAVPRPVKFFKTFLQVALPPPTRIFSHSKNLRIKTTPEEILGKGAQKLDLSLEKISFFPRYNSFLIGYFPVPGIIFLRSFPIPSNKIFFKKQPLKILMDSFDLFSSFLMDDLRKKLKEQTKIIVLSARNNVMFIENVSKGFFRRSLELKKWVKFEFFLVKAKESKQRLSPPRIPLPQVLPKGSIGMLLKGMSESLISLTSRLDQTTKKAS